MTKFFEVKFNMDWSKADLIEEKNTYKKWKVQVTDTLRDKRSLLCLELDGLLKEDLDDSYTIRGGEEKIVSLYITALDNINLLPSYTMYAELICGNCQERICVCNQSRVFDRFQFVDLERKKTVERVIIPNLKMGEAVECNILINLNNYTPEGRYFWGCGVYIELDKKQDKRTNHIELE